MMIAPTAPKAPSRLLVSVLLAPLGVAAWIGFPNPLRGDPYPLSAGAGWFACASLLAALLLWILARGPRRGLALLLVLPLAALAAKSGVSDAFEWRRAFTLECVWFVALAAGSVLFATERELLARGVILVSLIASAAALLESAFVGDNTLLAGSLGNTGLLSQLALPGAVIGARLCLARKGSWRIVSALAVVGFGIHAGLSPVLAGALSFTGVILLSIRKAGLRAVPLALVPLLLLGIFRVGQATPAEPSVQAQEAAGDFGGAEVRGRIWASLGGMVSEFPWLGSGAGQFQASYPPHRDPLEAIVSRAGVCSEAITEVNHAHNDALQVVVENGLPLGSAFACFLALAAWRALRRSAQSNVSGDLAAAALAVLVNGLFHAPLSANAPVAWLGFLLIGTLFAGNAVGSRKHATTPLFVSLIAVWFGAPLIAHGHALRDYVTAVQASDGRAASAALERALEAEPDSTVALALRARLKGDLDGWRAVLERRPATVEALEAVGTAAARRGAFDEAHVAWTRALYLSANSPRILRNLTRLSLDRGAIAEAGMSVLALRECGCLENEWLEKLAYARLLSGEMDGGAMLLGLSEERLSLPNPELINQLARTAKDKGVQPRSAAFTAWARWLWAQEHLAAGSFDLAAGSYRRSLAASKPYIDGGAPSLRLEFSAALVRAGKTEEARDVLAGLAFQEKLWSALPTWAQTALREAQLFVAK